MSDGGSQHLLPSADDRRKPLWQRFIRNHLIKFLFVCLFVSFLEPVTNPHFLSPAVLLITGFTVHCPHPFPHSLFPPKLQLQQAFPGEQDNLDQGKG